MIELLVVIALIGIVASIGLPLYGNAVDSLRLGASARDVERELQTARLKAVSARHAMRVRFDCPSAGSFRMVELIGTPSSPATADSATNRCTDTVYPYPSSSMNVLVRPNNDGPVRLLQPETAFTAAQTIEFWPDGTAHAGTSDASAWPIIPPAGITITVTRRNVSKSITVNGVGRIQLQ